MFKKIGKKIGRGFKKVGRALKKGLGKVAKAFGKLGPLGSIALSFMLPGMGTWLSSLAGGNSFLAPIAQGIQNAASFVKDGVGRVFNKITDAIEFGMNKVSGIVPGGKGELGTNFRNWVSETTGGFIEPSTTGVEDITIPETTKTITGPEGFTKEITVPETTISAEAQVGIGGPKIPQTPKGMTDPVYVDGIGTDLKKGFYESADLEKYYTGVEAPVNLGVGSSSVFNSADALDKATMRTSTGLQAPKPGGSYFQRSKRAFKTVAPITAMGAEIQAAEDAEKFAALQLKKQQAEYFADVAQSTLMRTPDPNTNYINFNNPNPSTEDIYALQNAYGLILS